MPTEFSFLPDLASTFAWQVDALYILMVVLTIIFTGGVFAAIAVSNVLVGLLGYVWARRELNRDVRAGYSLGISA